MVKLLGESFKIQLGQRLSEPFVYKGKIKDSSNKIISEKVFVFVNQKDAKKEFEGKIIAFLFFENDTEPFFITSPMSYIFYEPDIRHKISKVSKRKIKRAICTNEKSCGTIIFNRNTSRIRVLLIKNKKNKNWSFPKGHVELGETERETAKRETLEETGLEVEIIDGFRETVSYNLSKKIKKNVVFFVAKATSDEVTIQKKEVRGFKWATHKEVLSSLRYFNDINIYNKAKKFFLNVKFKV